jgi:hypothetical protein
MAYADPASQRFAPEQRLQVLKFAHGPAHNDPVILKYGDTG